MKVKRPEGAVVSEMAFEDFAGHVMSVEDYMQFSIVELLDKGVRALLRMDKRLGRWLKKHDMMLDKQDKRVECIESDMSKRKANAGL